MTDDRPTQRRRDAIARRLRAPFRPKVFCLSMQRTGTTSVGVFFHDHGFWPATYPISVKNDWTNHWFRGDYKSIFRSPAFRVHDVFEDDPWWCGHFYRHLFWRFPRSRFVLVEREADRWFESMVRLGEGMTLGNGHRHAWLYHREAEFDRAYPTPETRHPYSLSKEARLPLGEEQRAHYTALYRSRNDAVREFFAFHRAEDRLFSGRLEDADLWVKLGAFMGLHVGAEYQAHANQSPR